VCNGVLTILRWVVVVIMCTFTDLAFTEMIEQTNSGASILFYPNGKFLWSRHIVIRVLQPNFDLHDYPLDSHDIRIKFGSYSHSVDVIKLGFKDPAVDYVIDTDGEVNFEKNPIWHHDQVMHECHYTIRNS
jgi:hypothetical protein